jgi:hypothetical protein
MKLEFAANGYRWQTQEAPNKPQPKSADKDLGMQNREAVAVAQIRREFTSGILM